MTTIAKSTTNSQERILQIGCGVVGSANIKAYKYYGFDVIGLDVIPEIIKKMNDCGIETRHPNDDLTDWNDVSVILISVPTPLDKETKRLSMKYVWSTVDTIVSVINNSTKRVIVTMRSTVPPGLTRHFRDAIAQKTKKEFYVAFQPEFLRAVTAEEDALHPWKVLFGYDKDDIEVYKRLRPMLLRFVNNDENHLRIMTLEEAEVHKCIHNFSNGLRISFANAIYGMISNINKTLECEIDTQNVLNCVSDTAESFLNPRYGIRVGQPYGGVCLPKDCPELIGMAKEYKTDERLINFLEGVELTNEWIAEKTDLQKTMDESPNLMKFSDLKK